MLHVQPAGEKRSSTLASIPVQLLIAGSQQPTTGVNWPKTTLVVFIVCKIPTRKWIRASRSTGALQDSIYLVLENG